MPVFVDETGNPLFVHIEWGESPSIEREQLAGNIKVKAVCSGVYDTLKLMLCAFPEANGGISRFKPRHLSELAEL